MEFDEGAALFRQKMGKMKRTTCYTLKRTIVTALLDYYKSGGCLKNSLCIRRITVRRCKYPCLPVFGDL